VTSGLTYNAAYSKGWAAAARTSDLDAAETRYLRRHGHEQRAAWEDGWMDYATSREKWHLRDCPNHPACEVA
jgi:hypothetical protein